ncbi:hypothetical protein GDO78_009991 [Eleutherodactylus coqui]|uniref:Uncharacterized protein n=1 Tax=Eleutherodactylus coqui TaxID=57060 RepID=A0A8J6FD09_ELECQ|nr:hypothetical protein GDO78_009991 [Eleutherodactylus coqui]
MIFRMQVLKVVLSELLHPQQSVSRYPVVKCQDLTTEATPVYSTKGKRLYNGIIAISHLQCKNMQVL